MKKILLYIDHTVAKMFVEKVNENGEKKIGLSSPHNFVYTADIIARIIDIDTEEQVKTRLDPGYDYYNVIDFKPLKSESGVYFDEAANAYKASEYGFVVYDNGRLRWLNPLTVTRDKMKAYFNIYPTNRGKIPNIKDIEENLHNFGIMASLGSQKINEQLEKIHPEKPKLTRVLVAQGKEPVNGHEEYYLPLLDVDKKAGEILPDGRIDFKEKGTIIEIVKDQEVLKRVPAVKPQDGYNVYGDKAPAEMEPPKGYKKGENMVQSGKDANVMLSAIDGCLDVNKRLISVLPVVVINGDVNYDSGNIDFNGSVQITGSVLPGFSVKAKGDVYIGNTVEDAIIEADGDITVKMGVVGKESVRLTSGGRITAKYFLQAKVEATGDIIVEDSIINCNVFSNNKVQVVAKHGKIIGGKTTALYEIEVNVSGAINETETQLSVGRNLFIEKELEAVNAEIKKWREEVTEVMRKMKVSFGEAVFENPKEYISRLPSVKKKQCLLLLKELSTSNKELKTFSEEQAKIQSKLRLEREPYIIIKNKAYPGTVISIKKSVKKLDQVVDNVKYYEDPNDKIIRFTPAV